MKIIYKKGDFLEGPENVIVHGCNSQGKMGSGAAKAVREKYPEAYVSYINRYNESGLSLGDMVFEICRDRRIVVNAVTQAFYGFDGGRYVSYDAIADCMGRLDKASLWDESRNGLEIAMPKIGSGLGGGDWAVIESIIESCFKRIQPVVYSP